jgi:putative heme iron utilization protein
VQQPAGPVVPSGPPDAFAARCLLRAARAATLATQSGGQPYASLVTPATLPDGGVLLLISALAVHTRHLQAEPRCAVMVTGVPAEPANQQTAPRLTVTGRAERADDPALRRYWVDRHPYAFYAGFSDFSLWRVIPESFHFVAGFGRAHMIPARQLLPQAAACDAIAGASTMLRDVLCGPGRPVPERVTRARGLDGAWHLLSVDVDGLEVVRDATVARIAFDAPVHTAAEARAALLRLASPDDTAT